MTKKDLVRRIAADLNIDQVLTKQIVQMTLDGILQTVRRSGRIELRNFGVFEIKTRAARKARNPKTNQEVAVPPKKVLVFQPGKNVAIQMRSSDKPAMPPG